jgi:dimethylglycine dehydrogenase
MKSHARVVVIGGGIGGCSALYHLTQEGWDDVVLVERDELTSGTTWHSAAQCPNLAFNQLLLGLRSYTIDLYTELAADPDYPINYHTDVGGLRLITDQQQLDACHHIISVADGMGVELELITPQQAADKNPLLETDAMLAALYDPRDGDIDPAQLCQALARRSRNAGAEIYRQNPVVGLTQKASHEWIVHTRNGDIHCEHIVIAAGYRANEVGAFIGLEYPVVSMEHMYFVTEPIEALVQREQRVAMVRCPRDRFYLRQEKQGLLVGIYEQDCKTFGLDGIDPDFVNALCPNDLERCLPDLEPVFERLPCLSDAGIVSMVTGPIAYASDAGPLVGKTPGMRNTWSINGLRVGIGEGGGYGKMLAQMIVHGATEWDCWQLDPRRISRAASTQAYTALKAIEDYRHEFQWHLPHEHRPAGRPLRSTALYPVLSGQEAEFTVVNGWERVSFFKPATDFAEQHGYGFNNWHPVVEKEVAWICRGVGVLEVSGFNRFSIQGPGAQKWLDSLSCSRVATRPGKVSLNYFLKANGRVSGEATLALLEADHFWYGSAAAAELRDWDWLHERLPDDGSIQIKSLTESYTTLMIAGPKSRDLLAALSPRNDWSDEAFPWMSVRPCQLGHFNAMVMSISFSGESGYELHIPNEHLVGVYQLLQQVGEPMGLVGFGMYALDSMRIEMGYGHWKSDLIDEFNPVEAGLGRFIEWDKPFPGKNNLLEQIEEGNRRERVLLDINCDTAPCQPGESIYFEDKVVGTITSGGWGFRVAKNLAMAYLIPEYVTSGCELIVMLHGEGYGAKVCEVRLT